MLCVSQFRDESRAAGPDGETQGTAGGAEDAVGRGVTGCSPEEQQTAAGSYGVADCNVVISIHPNPVRVKFL